MSSLNYGELCRLCLVKESVSIPIFDGEGDARRLFLKIAACLPVKVSREDRLPKKICDDCLYKLENQYLFWNSTANAEKQLLQWFDADSLQDEKKIVPTSNLETEQLDLKQEILDPDQGSELAKSLSRVEAVLAEEAGRTTRNAEEEEEEESEEEGSNSEESEEDDNDNDADEPSKDDNESDENYEELEPTTFVNVSLACDEAGPSGMQQQQQPSTAPSTSTSGPAASGPANKMETTPAEGTVRRSMRGSLLPPQKPPKINCDCGKTFYDTKLYELHMLKHEQRAERKRNGYTCEVCNTVFKKVRSMYAHQKEMHKKCECNICHEVFDCQPLMLAHKKEHARALRFQCELCPKNFALRKSLNNHLLRHNEKEKYFCDSCNHSTKNKSNLISHIANRHAPKHELKFVCDVCGKRCLSAASLRFHEKTHGEKTYLCDDCGKSFYAESNLVAHRKTHDPNRDRYQCDICGKRYFFVTGLKSHMESHLEKDKYKCTYCGKVVNSAGYLAVHLRRHTGEKPFACDVCGKTFISRSYLRSHSLVHSGVKRYHCEECGKEFAQRYSYTIHMRYHSGLRPFECEYCPKAFVSKSLLRGHERTHV